MKQFYLNKLAPFESKHLQAFYLILLANNNNYYKLEM